MEKTDLPERTLLVDPSVDPAAFVARGAVLVGDVRIAAHASVWYNAVLRGDINYVALGEYSNIQDGSIIHVENARPCIVGDKVTVGHGVIMHACTIETGCLIGMGSIILSGAVIGRGSIVAAGALITEGMQVEPSSLMVGVPAKLLRRLDAKDFETNLKWAQKYAALAELHRSRGYEAEP
ncbi:MAG: gamma carbonic anhydrase family protein [Spirochaetales bacterium]|nr:gamma carbonic anhydrase family protein [Spirochaetales bacterium]